MDTLPPVENAQFSTPSVSTPNMAPAPEERGASASTLAKKPFILAAFVLLILAIIATVVWAFSRESAMPTSISPGDSDEFSQTEQVVTDTTGASFTGDTREDSPGFIGGRAEEGQSATPDGCTLDTQTCPDRTVVERQGPSCEFAACPAEVAVSVQPGWTAYQNTRYKYAISYPNDWVAKEDGGVNAANAGSAFVQIFRPGDEAVEDDFHGLYIEYTDVLPPDLPQVTMNGISMWRQDGTSGANYYVSISGTEQYLFIVGAEGNTGDETRDAVLREIFATFRVR